jgi:hypothetical protein
VKYIEADNSAEEDTVIASSMLMTSLNLKLLANSIMIMTNMKAIAKWNISLRPEHVAFSID